VTSTRSTASSAENTTLWTGAGTKMSRLLTAEDLAERWQVPISWIYAKTRSGAIPRVPLPGKYYRYRLEEIEAFERGDCNRTTQSEGVS
jgi:hypothetical protein